MLLIPLMALTVWRLWIADDQTVKAFKVLKGLKILHRKRQPALRSLGG